MHSPSCRIGKTPLWSHDVQLDAVPRHDKHVELQSTHAPSPSIESRYLPNGQVEVHVLSLARTAPAKQDEHPLAVPSVHVAHV